MAKEEMLGLIFYAALLIDCLDALAPLLLAIDYLTAVLKLKA